MKQLTLTLVVLAVISSIAYYTLTHPNRGEVDRLNGELSQLEAQNDSLRDANKELEREVIALREDPRLAERRAREVAGLARPDELIFKFEKPESDALPVEVRLDVKPQKITLAGETVGVSDLPAALELLSERLPDARVEVVYAKPLGAIARQRIEDIVSASPIEHARYTER